MFDPLRSKTRLLFSISAAVVLGIGGASVLGWSALNASSALSFAPQVTDAQVQPALDLSEAFVNLAQVVTPAVIRIEAERPGAPSGQFPQQFRDLLPPDFPFPGAPGSPVPEPDIEPQLMTAGGSGFLVTPDGFILTNDHVVSGATQIRVFLADRREFIAELVGTDPTTDVAVIKINGSNLPTLSFGQSAAVRVGEWVMAVGNPGLGGGGSQLAYTVTSGIVSAKGRGLPVIRDGLRMQGESSASFAIEDFIQTDAVINPGNSGGPLVNVRGQVVGINSAIASETGYYQGYGFAIPIDLARRIMEDLVEFGEVHRAYLGVSMQAIDPVDAEYYGLPRTTGVLVQDVLADGPAGAAGLRQEDVIVEVDGEPIERNAQLQSLIAQKRPGDEVSVSFFRDGRPEEVRVRLGQAPLQPRAAQATTVEPTRSSLLGMEFRPLDAPTAQQLGYETAGGVVIGTVSPTGPAGRRGIGGGERVLSINQEAVASVEDVERILTGIGRGGIASFRLGDRQGATRIVNLRMPE